MRKPLRLLKKLPELLKNIIHPNLDKFKSFNLYFQDESRFGLKTHVGRCLTARGVKPIVKYQHAFKNTYVYGSFSPINGDSFVYEIEGTTSEIFYSYILEFSKYKPEELKIIIIDNAGFHSLTKYEIPDNIKFIRIPPYSPELNHSEKIWAYIKQFYKNKVFGNIENVKVWLANFIKDNLTSEIIQSITHHKLFLDAY
ncbi:IS630 family transposase, partial [Thermococcus sp.]|uniref:IS630 family transposase n=1 Tax=Thermococcus sp. TaxID=35749 RepID=UPI0026166810